MKSEWWKPTGLGIRAIHSLFRRNIRMEKQIAREHFAFARQMFVSTRYTLSHRAIRALSVAIATTCIGLDSASMLLPIAGLASASALASSTSQAPLRNLLPFAEHQGEDRGSSLPGFSWLQNKATRMLIATHSANRAKKGVQSVSIRKQNSGDKTLIVLGEVRGQVAAVCWPSYAGWRFGLGAESW